MSELREKICEFVEIFKIAADPDLMKETFKKYDVDNSGYLCKKELKTVSKDKLKMVLNKKPSIQRVEKCVVEFIDKFDYDNDGKISYEEFENLFIHLCSKSMTCEQSLKELGLNITQLKEGLAQSNDIYAQKILQNL